MRYVCTACIAACAIEVRKGRKRSMNKQLARPLYCPYHGGDAVANWEQGEEQ